MLPRQARIEDHYYSEIVGTKYGVVKKGEWRKLLAFLGEERMLDDVVVDIDKTYVVIKREDRDHAKVLVSHLHVLETGKAFAYGSDYYDDCFSVLRGAKVGRVEKSLEPRYVKTRKRLEEEGVIVGGEFKAGRGFDSLSDAARVVTGSCISGPKYWKKIKS